MCVLLRGHLLHDAIGEVQEKEGEDSYVAVHPLVDVVLSGGGRGWHDSHGLVVEPIPETMIRDDGPHLHPPYREVVDVQLLVLRKLGKGVVARRGIR